MAVTYVVCAAGEGSRFHQLLDDLPKALIRLFGVTLLEWSLRSLPLYAGDQVVIITQKKHRVREKVEQRFCEMLPFNTLHWVELHMLTRGQLETAYCAHDLVPQGNSVVVYNCDTYFQSKTLTKFMDNPKIDGIIPCAQAEGTAWSFCLTDSDDCIVQVAEKERISSWATVGFYFFRDAQLFFNKVEAALNVPPREKNEYYVAPLYDQYIQDGYTIMMDRVFIFKPMGTPEQIYTYWGMKPQLLKSNNVHPVLVIDLDNTITIEEPEISYENKKPNLDIIKKMHEFNAAGWEIIIFTSRRMQTFKNDEAKIIKDIGAITCKWLERNDVPYDGIRFGKPFAHKGFYVDDKAMTPEQFLRFNVDDSE